LVAGLQQLGEGPLALHAQLGDVCLALALPLLGTNPALLGHALFELLGLEGLLPLLKDKGVGLLLTDEGLLVLTLNL
jgi:hypothetical protein